MATWKADVFVNSKVGQISTTVQAATFSGAQQQIYAKHGDVQQIVNLREVGSGESFSVGDIGGTWSLILLCGAFWALFTWTPWVLMGLGGAAGTWFGEKVTRTSISEINDNSGPGKDRATMIILILMLLGGGVGFIQGNNFQQEWNNETPTEVRKQS